VIVISKFEDVRDIFAKKINRRPEEEINNWRNKRYGVIFTNGDEWRLQRRMFVNVVRSSGFGRGAIEASVERIWPKVNSYSKYLSIISLKLRTLYVISS